VSDHEGLGRHANPTPIQHRILAVVVAAQAGWLIYLCSRGWFYRDDFTLLSQAVHHSLTPGYLTQSFNGHLTPGMRLTFWILAHTSRLHYAPTVALRIVLQAVATILLFRLLTVVSRSLNVALAITTVYCASPLLVPGTLWLSSSINLLPAQICVLVAYLAHLRRAETRALRWSLVAGVALLVGAAFWEKTALTAGLLVILTLGWLSTGSLRHRLMGLLRDGFGWILTLGPVAGFTAYFFANGYGPNTRQLPIHDALHLIWLQWSHSLWAAVIGAPWHWHFSGPSFSSVAAPRLGTVIAGQCAFALLLVVSWRRSRWRGLFAWTLPLIAVAAGEVLIGIARYATFGNLPALTFSYAFDLAVPTALAAALAFGAPNGIEFAGIEPVAVEPVVIAEAAGDTLPADPGQLGGRPWRRRLQLAAGAVCCAVLVSSAVGSALAWTSRWHKSPSKPYVDTLLTGIAAIGPAANIYDTDVPARVLPRSSPNRHLSDLLALTSARFTFDGGLPQPQLVNHHGQIVPATFHSVASRPVAPKTFCPTLVKGVTSVDVALKPAVARGVYFLRIVYFQQRLALVTVTVRDAAGNVVPLRVDPTVDFDQQLGVMLVALDRGSPAKVTFSSSSEATNVCMSRVSVGTPSAAAR
jgi:hypothetical protein